MSSPPFRFADLFHLFAAQRLRAAPPPRKPRHRALRVGLGLIGLALLGLLVMFGLVVGAAMLGGGLAWRLWKRRGQPIARDRRVLDAQYRVVDKAMLN